MGVAFLVPNLRNDKEIRAVLGIAPHAPSARLAVTLELDLTGVTSFQNK
jgi:hypothetical protein